MHSSFVACRCVAILSRTLGVKKSSASDDHCQHSESESLGDRLENLCIRLSGHIELRGAYDHTLENSTTRRSDKQRLLVCSVCIPHDHTESWPTQCQGVHAHRQLSCLQESQGHVISSLTLRIEATVQQLVAAQQENSRLRERLRVLRVSIGDDGPAELENAPPFLDVSVAGVLTAEVRWNHINLVSLVSIACMAQNPSSFFLCRTAVMSATARKSKGSLCFYRVTSTQYCSTNDSSQKH